MKITALKQEFNLKKLNKMTLLEQYSILNNIKSLISIQTNRDLTENENKTLLGLILKLQMNFSEIKFTPNNVMRVINAKYGVNISVKTRKQLTVWLRQIAHFICIKYMKDYPLRVIGETIGGQHHATVLNSIKKVQNRIDTNDTEFLFYLKEIKELFNLK